MFTLAFLGNAILVAIVLIILCMIADYFIAKAGLDIPRQIVWLLALLVWVVVVFFGGPGIIIR